MKSDKMPHIIYANTESLVKKRDQCTHNPESSSATKIGEHIPCGHSMSPIWVFDNIENKRILYCRKDWMKTFCICLREHATM